jgi:hypothetical protein
MKLTKEQVEKLSAFILKRLEEKDLLVLKTTPEKLLEKINDTILENLRQEDDLDREVEEILKAHSGAVDSSRVDYRKMFNMVKGKLARERGIVL